MSDEVSSRPVVVIGLGVTGEAVVRYLLAGGRPVVVVDDATDEAVVASAAQLDVPLVSAPDRGHLSKVLAGSSGAVVSPGVPPSHPVFSLCDSLGLAVTTEIELAGTELASLEAPPTVVAVTGTNGKTTVVTMIVRMLAEAGVTAVAAGNIGVPLLDALATVRGARESGKEPIRAVVVETSSFQLALTRTFRPDIAVWLNLSEDHLDVHRSVEEYVAAKARIWANQGEGDLAIVNANDPTVMSAGYSAPSRVISFGFEKGDYRIEDGALRSPGGTVIVPIAEMARSFPHDLVNGLAASAAALEAGANSDACSRVLREFSGLRHRIELVGEKLGVRYFDDSKATTPASVEAALAGFTSVVLIAGGRNKGLDLSPLASQAERCRGVVAIGESAGEVEEAFRSVTLDCQVVRAPSMEEAVRRATEMARPGDAVLLSPGCASFDWYRSYGERGDDYARAVRRQIKEGR